MQLGWHLEVKQIKVSGKPGYHWCAVDQDGEVLDFYFTPTRDEGAALASTLTGVDGHEILISILFDARVRQLFARPPVQGETFDKRGRAVLGGPSHP